MEVTHADVPWCHFLQLISPVLPWAPCCAGSEPRAVGTQQHTFLQKSGRVLLGVGYRQTEKVKVGRNEYVFILVSV